MTPLSLEHIACDAHPAGAPSLRILYDVSLSLAAGELVALLGPNGAGKSTLLHCASAAMQPVSGTVQLHEQSIDSWLPQRRARTLAVLPQRAALAFPLAVSDVVALSRYPHASGAALDAGIVKDALCALDIESLAARSYTSLSGGEQQRVQLARVIAQLAVDRQLAMPDGAVLLLDEPVAALDLAHQQQLMLLLRGLCSRGVAVLVVLHDINLASRYADRVAVLDRGRLYAAGAPRDVVSAEMLADVYGFNTSLLSNPGDGLPVVLP